MVAFNFGQIFDIPMQIAKTIAIGAVGGVASVAGAAANEANDNFNAAAHSTTASAETTAEEATATTVASSTAPSVAAPSQSASVVTVVQTSAPQTAAPTLTVIASEESPTAPVTITVLPASETKPSVVCVTQSSAEESTKKTEPTSKHASSTLHLVVDKHHAPLYQNTTAKVDENDKRALLKPRLATSTLMALSAATTSLVPQSHTPSTDAYSTVSTSTETYSFTNDLGKRWLDSITLGQTAVPSSTFDALDALAAPVTYSTCGPGQACYGTDGTLTTSVSIAATPTPDLKPSDDPITTTNSSVSGSERLALYASPLVPARYRGDTLVREQVDGVPPYAIAGFASGWRPTAVTGMGSDGYRVLPPTGTAVAYGWNPTAVTGMGSAGYNATPPTGTAAASRSPIWFGNFVSNPNDFIRTRWQESQKTWTRRPDIHERKATSTTDVTSVIGNPTSLATLAASPGFGWQDSHAISNPATAGATTMLDPNATSPIPFSTLAASSARLSDVKRAVEPKITSRSSVNDFLQPTTMATSYKPKTGRLSTYKPTATTNIAAPSESSQKDDAEIKGSQTGSSQPKAGLEFPGVILDPNDEDMWAECTVGEPRDRSSHPRPKDANKPGRAPARDTSANTGNKPDRNGQQSVSVADSASALSAIPTKPSVSKRTLAQSRNDGLPAAYATVLPTASGFGVAIPASSLNYYQPVADSYSTRAGSSRPAPSGSNGGNVRSSHGRTPGQRFANIFRHSRNRGHALPNTAEPATGSDQGAVVEPATGAGSTELLDPNDINDPPPDYSSPPSYHSQDREDDQMGGLHSAEDGDSRSTMEMETFGDNQGTTSPQGSGSRPLVADNTGDNRPGTEQSTSENAPGRSGGGVAASGGPGSGSDNQIGSTSWPSTSDRSDRQVRKRALAVPSEYGNRRRTVDTEKGSVDRTTTADSLIELHAHARRSPGGSQSKHDKGERRSRRCRKKKDKKRPKNQPAQDEFECEPEPQIETQGAQPDANTPYGAPSSQPFSPPETVQKQANTGAAPQQPGYGQTGEVVENPPFVYQKRPATPPYPPQDGQPSDHGLDKWEDLPPADRRKLMYNKQLKEMYPDDSSEDFYPPLRPASLAPTEPDTNRWTGGRLSQDGRNMYTPPGDMSSSISSGVSESRYNPYKQEENRGQSSSKPPRRNRLRRHPNQPPRDPPSYADANPGRPEPVPSQSGDDDAEASDDEPPGYTGQYHLNQRKRTDVADQRTGVPQGPDGAWNRQNAGLGVSR